jgi:hypothetical protein
MRKELKHVRHILRRPSHEEHDLSTPHIRTHQWSDVVVALVTRINELIELEEGEGR